MRYIISLTLCALLYSSCKKDISVCKDYKEITGREKAADISAITAHELLDTLAKYPQLVPYQVNSTQYVAQISCHVYYNNLLIFSDAYSLSKEFWNNDSLSYYGRLLKTDPGISLNPTISYKNAIKEAKKYINLDHSCIAYQLGLYDSNPWDVSKPQLYRLAWKIMDAEKTYKYVVMDAVTNQLLTSDNGIRWLD